MADIQSPQASENHAAQPPACPACGATPHETLPDGLANLHCPACLDSYLRTIDAEFLDNFARFGARSRQVVAEVCLRALVLSDAADRKILGATVYEQFVQAAAGLINLYYALQARNECSITHSFLSFDLDETHCLNFFADMVEFSPTDILDSLGLVHPDRVPDLFPELLQQEQRELVKALRETLRDVERIADYQEVGEAALVRASEQIHSVFALADRLPWEAGRLTADRVAAIALDTRGGGVSLSALSIDEARLAEVVDGIDVMTRLSRNLIYAFLSINAPDVLMRAPR